MIGGGMSHHDSRETAEPKMMFAFSIRYFEKIQADGCELAEGAAQLDSVRKQTDVVVANLFRLG